MDNQNLEGRIDTGLYMARNSTIRTWLLLLSAAKSLGEPLILTAADIAVTSQPNKPISRESAGKAINELVALKMIEREYVGRTSVITIIKEEP